MTRRAAYPAIGAYGPDDDRPAICLTCASSTPGHVEGSPVCLAERREQDARDALDRRAVLPPAPSARPCALCLASPPVLDVPVRRCLACLVGHHPVATLLDLPERRTVSVFRDVEGTLRAHDGNGLVELEPEERETAEHLLAAAERREGRAA